jgi:deoxyribonuclease-4
MTRLLGAHVSVAGGLDNAFARGLESHCTALQIFTKNANRWQGKPISNDDALAFQQAWQKSGIGPVIAHDAYLINLASPKQDVWEKSKAALRRAGHASRRPPGHRSKNRSRKDS